MRFSRVDLIRRDLEHVLERPAQRADRRFGSHFFHDADVALDLLVANGVLGERPARLRDPPIHLGDFFVSGAASDHLFAKPHGLVHVVAEPCVALARRAEAEWMSF